MHPREDRRRFWPFAEPARSRVLQVSPSLAAMCDAQLGPECRDHDMISAPRARVIGAQVTVFDVEEW